ncbi:hypothetical protein [Kribbella sp. CA-293567]|uniref:hypothetical protein n=1 Tax=Kribbella sp. CA-293567 TaxID=3002436 RepID=UPI0022DCE440|nr:hypothetical protein [Kribbella sp. CA-293567]WBQ03225.1 hypothetical protein OX958_24970 [Kribbella sp. CA-293567]
MTIHREMPLPTHRRVRVWFGGHVIAEYTAEPETAMRHQAAMTRRFASLCVTIEPAVSDADVS